MAGAAETISTKGYRTLPMSKVCLPTSVSVCVCFSQEAAKMTHSFVYLVAIEVNFSQYQTLNHIKVVVVAKPRE
jgi:hypothetical protein